jgi:putative acetyltransferase
VRQEHNAEQVHEEPGNNWFGDAKGARVMRIRRANPTEGGVLVEIWLRSVRATHTFLSEDDIQSLLPATRDYLTSDEPELWSSALTRERLWGSWAWPGAN